MIWRFWLSDKTVRKSEELPIYCQRRNCSPGILVSSKVWFMWIFAGFCWKGGVKCQWDRPKWRLSLLSLAISSEPSHSRPQLLYCTMQHLSGSSLTPKRMTFSDLEWSFCVKIWSELGIQWVGVLAFGENCLEICRATHILLAATKNSPARYCTGDISVMGLFIGVIWRGSVKPVNCIHVHSSHTCRSLSLMSVEK